MNFTFFAIIALTTFAIVALIGRSKNKNIGQVKCKRCGHVGVPKNKMVPFHGPTPVCKKCSSEEWEKV